MDIEAVNNSYTGRDYALEESKLGSEKVDAHETVVPAAFSTSSPVHRGLRPHHVQLIAISGAVGAGVFISIGGPLTSAGPLGLLIGVSIWSFVVWCFANCLIEMATLLPLPGGFVYYTGRFLDPSARFALGWNYVIQGIAFVCFELTAFNVLVSFWKPDINPAICISAGLVALGLANGINVRLYGEIEFWISILKVILIIGLFLYTFVSMLGGNPQHDRYGFRYWKTPGLFATEDVAGRLKGIWKSITWATFAIAGPDFISLVAGETQHPRRVIPRAYRTTIYRILFFYVGSALCVGINVPFDDASLLGAISNGAPGAAKSPYVINMQKLGIPVLPDIVNAIVLTSVFSTASSFLYGSSRALYSLGLEGQAPKIVTRTTKRGVPYVAVFFILLVSCLSYLAVGKGSAKVLDWFVNLTSSCQLITWICIGGAYVRFHAALKAQGLRKGFLPVSGAFQPYSGWFALIASCFTMVFTGYYLMEPGAFVVADFIFVYGACFIFIVLFWGSKIKGVWRGEERWFGYRAEDIDLHSGVEEVEKLTVEYEQERSMEGPRSFGARVYDKVF